MFCLQLHVNIMASPMPTFRNDVTGPNRILSYRPAPSVGISDVIVVIKASSVVEQFIAPNIAAL
jgi:hypothetical protein